MVVNILFLTIEETTKSEIKMFSTLVLWELLMAWNFREPSGKRLPSFQLLSIQRLHKIAGTPVVNKTASW